MAKKSVPPDQSGSHTPDPSRAPDTAAAMPSRRRFRRRWLAVLLGLLAIVAVVAVELPQWLSPAPSATIWQTITGGITDGTVPKQTALEAFAYVYRVDIPGVSVPAGTRGDDGPTSGSGVMRWVQGNWNQLTPDQQAVINRYLTPDPSDTVFSGPTSAGPPSAAPSGGASPAAQAQPAFQLLSARKAAGAQLVAAPGAPTALWQAMWNEVQTDIAHIGPKLGMAVIPPGFPYPNVSLEQSQMSGGDAFFLTVARDKYVTFAGHDVSGPYYTPCNIIAYKEAWQNEAVTTSGGVSPRLHVLITHEVVHCYQNVVWGSSDTANAVPPWIEEGTAMWLAADDTGVAEPELANVWTKGYFGRVSTALTNRTYDAFGYYAYLANLGRDLWKLMLPAWQAAAPGPLRSDPFIAVLTGDNPDVRNNWAESYLREDGWGNPWVAYGFGLPSAAQVPRVPAQAQADPGWTGSLEGRSNLVLNVTSSSGEVVLVTTDGLASVHDGANHSATAFQNESFCNATEGCVCPPGTLLAGQNMATQQLEIPFVAAFNAPEGGSKYAIIAYKLDELCKRPATPKPQLSVQPQPKNPCGSNCTNSNGDPHLLTVSKNRYDFQAAGEFTLLRSADGSLDIQARQEPYGQGLVSTNTAIAAKVGSHSVGVYMTKTGLEAHLDGSPLDLAAGPKDLGGGARIAAIDKGFEIDFPDGTKLWTLSVGQYGINAQISPSASLKTSGVGLLGPVVPGGLGVPALPDGTRLPAVTDAAQRFAVLYGQFADAWRLTDATTLFDYDSGKTTATYTVKPYPAAPKYQTLTDLSSDQTAAGTSACSAISDQGLHDDCVFDVGVTGQAGFADTYAATQTFYDTGILAATPKPPAAPSDTPAPGTVSGNVFTVTQGTRIGGYALGPDDTAYLSVQTVDNKFSLIAFDTKSGKIATQVDVAALTPVHFAAGSVWLPGIKTDANGRNCSVTRYDPTTLAEQATVATPCSPFDDAPPMVSDGDALWFVDTTKLDISTNLGAVITRIDPTTNAPGTSVQVPILGLNLRDSQGALFFFDIDSNYWRLTTGSTVPDSMGTMLSDAVPGGTGLWVSPDSGKTAQYFTSAGSPAATVQTGGSPVAGDAKAVYVDILGNSDQDVAESQLWRYPIDGSTPTKIAASPTLDGQMLGYYADPLPITNGDGVLKLWSTRGISTQTTLILLQWTPVP